MKKLITVIAVIVVVALGAVSSVVFADDLEQQNKEAFDVVEAYIGNIKGVTEQDKALCRSSWKNGGKYFHHFYNVKLTCTRQHISVDFDHQSED